MFDHKHYVPILKWKRGEYRAMSLLTAGQKSGLTPLFDLPLLDFDPPTGDSADPVFDANLDKMAAQVEANWGKGLPAFFDFGLLNPAALYAGAQHPVERFFAECAFRGVRAIPVTGLVRAPAYSRAAADAARLHATGLCIRLSAEELEAASLAGRLGDFLDGAGLRPGECDLAVDLSVTPTQPALVAAGLARIIGSLPQLASWRTLTVASGAFPQTLSAFPVGTHKLPRADRSLWMALRNQGPARLPTFGDYGVSHPILTVLPPAAINMSVSLRYTTASDWELHRGQGNLTPLSGGNAQFTSHARTLVAGPHYRGAGFSDGDACLAKIANGTATPGNPETWLRIAVNHHLAHVVDALASSGAP